MKASYLQTIVSHHESGHGKFRTYTIGFVLSLLLTLAAYVLVVNQVLSRRLLIVSIIGLALVQFVVQLIFFLHLGTESKPRWKFLVFSFMFMVVLILVIGSLWIMNNLNYHNMSPMEFDRYVRDEERL